MEPVAGDNQIEIPELMDTGKRDFEDCRNLFHDLANIFGVDNKRFEILVNSKVPELKKFKDRDQFCLEATIEEVQSLIDAL
jgi:hypothetical protein